VHKAVNHPDKAASIVSYKPFHKPGESLLPRSHKQQISHKISERRKQRLHWPCTPEDRYYRARTEVYVPW